MISPNNNSPIGKSVLLPPKAPSRISSPIPTPLQHEAESAVNVSQNFFTAYLFRSKSPVITARHPPSSSTHAKEIAKAGENLMKTLATRLEVFSKTVGFVFNKYIKPTPSAPHKPFTYKQSNIDKSWLSANGKNFMKNVEREYFKIKYNLAKSDTIEKLHAEKKWVDFKLHQLQRSLTTKSTSDADLPQLVANWESKYTRLKSTIEEQISTMEVVKPPQSVDQQIFRQSFDKLIKIGNELKVSPSNKLILDKEGEFALKGRQIGPTRERGSSDEAHTTLKAVLLLMRTGIENHLLTSYDLENLKDLQTILKDQFEATLAHFPHLKAEYDQVNELLKIDYVKQLEGVKISPANIGKILLQPEHTALRDDFLISGRWIGFTPDNIDPVIKEMVTQYKAQDKTPLTGLKQQLLILNFASGLIQRNIATPDQLKELFNLALKSKRKEVKDLASTAQSTKPLQKQDVLKTEGFFDIPNPAVQLTHQLDLLTSNKMNANEKKEFISRFVDDLHVMSGALFKHCHPSEFQGLAWTKKKGDDKEDRAPNIRAVSQFVNQVGSLVIQQILKDENVSMKERIKIYETFVDIAAKLIDKHDYLAAQAIMGGINNNAIYHIFKKEEEIYTSLSTTTKNALDRIRQLLSNDKNSKQLRENIAVNQKKEEPHVPFLGIYLTDLIMINDRTPDTIDGSINLQKIKQISHICHTIEHSQASIPDNRSLHYDINHEILKASYPNENEFYALSGKIRPAKKAG